MKRLLEYLKEAKVKETKRYIVTRKKNSRFGGEERVYKTEPLTLEELIKYYSYTLEVGKSWEHEKGNSKINKNPKNIKTLCDMLYKADNNAARDGYSGNSYSYEEVTSSAENITEKAKLKESRNEDMEYIVEAKGKVTKVISTLKAKKNSITGLNLGKLDKLAEEYKEVENQIEFLKDKREKTNAEIKDKMLDYFDIEDDVMTRVINTSNFVLQLSKRTIETKTKIDYNSIFGELIEMTPELAEKIEELKKKYTQITQVEKSPSLKIEGLFDGINKLIDSIKNKFKSWGKSFDARLEKLHKDAQMEPLPDWVGNTF